MKKRTFSLDCTNRKLCQKLHKILTLFINNAFPPNGSDCAQATRDSLLELSEKINSNENCEINKRQRPLLKTAITWYFEEVEVGDADQQKSLLLLIAKRKKAKP